jgi:glycine hydroxymethyltransferase
MDKKLWEIISKEIERQKTTLELIPSENFVDLETLFIVGSPLMNKYAEGYPSRRYYPGNKFIDEIENLAKERALKAFKLDPREWSVNVQPHSGSPANLAVYLGLIKPHEKIMGLNLFHGGHLTHGFKASYTGKIFSSVQYSVREDRIDYDELERLAKKQKPKIIISGTTAYPRILDFKRFYEISKKVGAFHLADIAHIAGLVIANLHPSPFPFADVVTLTTHKTLRGPRGAVIFMKKELEEKINRSVFPGLQGGPHMHTIAAIAFAFGKALKKDFYNYQKQIIKNSKKLADELIKRGFELYTGGTDNHLMMIDLENIGIGGRLAESLLEEANIVANRNFLPKDLSVLNPSGIRLGTPAVTSRGMKEKEMVKIAEFFERILIKKENPKKIKKEVIDLTKKFPLPYDKWKLGVQKILKSEVL